MNDRCFRWPFEKGFHTYFVAEATNLSFDPRDAIDTTDEPGIDDEVHVEEWVCALVDDDFCRSHLCDLLQNAFGYVSVSNEEIVSVITRMIVTRQLLLYRTDPIFQVSPVPLRKEVVEERAVPKDKDYYRCSVQVVLDATDEPLEDIALTMQLADGTEVEVATDADGLAELDDAYRGTFNVTSSILDATLDETFAFVKRGPPSSSKAGDRAGEGQKKPTGKWIARIKEYRVRTGDTLDAIAEAHSLTADRISYFNWGTIDPAEVNEHLRLDVGCTSTAEDGETCVFDNSDVPGAIYIPQRWSLKGLAHDTPHIIRVKLSLEPTVLLFSM